MPYCSATSRPSRPSTRAGTARELRIREAPAERRVVDGAVAALERLLGLRRHERRAAHRLLAAGDERCRRPRSCVAGADDRGEPGGAEAVDGHAGGGIRGAGEQRRHPRDVAVSSPAWFAAPNQTSSICSAGTPARATASRIASAARSSGRTPRARPPCGRSACGQRKDDGPARRVGQAVSFSSTEQPVDRGEPVVADVDAACVHVERDVCRADLVRHLLRERANVVAARFAVGEGVLDGVADRGLGSGDQSKVEIGAGADVRPVARRCRFRLPTSRRGRRSSPGRGRRR